MCLGRKECVKISSWNLLEVNPMTVYQVEENARELLLYYIILYYIILCYVMLFYIILYDA